MQQSSTTYYNLHAHPLTEIEIGSNVAVQNPRTKLWDIYGIITAISPNRKYYIKTSSSRVLVRNHHFIRRRVPLTMPTCTTLPDSPAAQVTQELCRSTRIKQPPNRLIEDPTSN